MKMYVKRAFTLAEVLLAINSVVVNGAKIVTDSCQIKEGYPL